MSTALDEPTATRPAVQTLRRYYLLKSWKLRDWMQWGLMGAFISKHRAACGVLLPQDFPERDRLAATRYVTVEDIFGAAVDELVRETSIALDPLPGLTTRSAAAVLDALDAIIAERNTMGYTRSTGPYAGQYANTLECTVHESVSLSANTASSGFELGDRGTARLTLSVTVQVGTSLDVAVETSSDNGATDTWRSIGSFTQATTTTTQRKSFSGCDRFIRTNPTIVGGAFTFSVAGEAC